MMTYTQYTPIKKKKICLNDIYHLFKYMDKQLEALNDGLGYTDFAGIKYDRKTKIYKVNFLVTGGTKYSRRTLHCAIALKFSKLVVGTCYNILVDSGIFKHNIINKFDASQDIHELFGNFDKAIELDDVIDLFKEMDSQFEEMINEGTYRSYFMEGFKINHACKSNDHLTGFIFHWDL